jgi:hypothetical protein
MKIGTGWFAVDISLERAGWRMRLPLPSADTGGMVLLGVPSYLSKKVT